jgi:hypothetical protein
LLTLSVDGTTTAITPALIAAIAQMGTDEDVEAYVERHSLDGLAAALEYAFERVEGTVTHRIMARELDCSPLGDRNYPPSVEPVARTYNDVAE